MGPRTSLFRVESYKKSCASHSSYGAQAAYDHNLRNQQPENADVTLRDLNVVMEDRPHGMQIEEFIDEELYRLREAGVENGTIRKNAIGTLEVVLRANNVLLQDGQAPADFNLNGWVDASVEWADRTFNPPEHEIRFRTSSGGEKTKEVQNVYCTVLHMDESNPHIHFLIMPVDDRGRLNAKYYLQKERFLSYQQEYNESVKEFGLECGVRGTPAKAREIQKYHQHINEAMAATAPEVFPGETAHDYRTRVNEVIKACHAHMADQDRDHERELNQAEGRLSTAVKGAMRDNRRVNEALGLGSSSELDMERIRSVGAKAQKLDRLERAMRDLPDRQEADELQARISEILILQEEREFDANARDHS